MQKITFWTDVIGNLHLRQSFFEYFKLRLPNGGSHWDRLK